MNNNKSNIAGTVYGNFDGYWAAAQKMISQNLNWVIGSSTVVDASNKEK